MLTNLWGDHRRCESRVRCLLLLTTVAIPVAAQSLVDASHLAAARTAFEESTSAPALKCQFSSVPPALNFSLRFQTGFSVTVPLSQFHGNGHGWDVLLRVTPYIGAPVFLTASEKLPDVPDTNISGEFTGTFVVGEGGYQVDAMLKDDAKRVCKSAWRIEATLQGPERGLHPSQPPETVSELAAKSAVPAGTSPPKVERLTVLLHAAPLVPGRVQLQPDDVMTLAGSLGSLLENLPARSVRVVIFSLDQRAVLYKKDDFDANDLDRAAKTIGETQLVVVDYRTLQNSAGPVTNVAAGLLRAELAQPNAPDAIVFLGPYSPMDARASVAASKLAPLRTPKLFYLQHHPYQPMKYRPFPWERDTGPEPAPCNQRTTLCGPPASAFAPIPRPDAIALVTKAARGEIIEVRQPQDFAVAIRRILARLGQK